MNTSTDLIKATDLVGRNVLVRTTGIIIDQVKDVIYDPKTNKVRALLLDPGGWFSEAKVILIQDVESIGEDAVVIKSDEMIKRASEVTEKVANIVSGGNDLTKTHVITEDGTDLGMVDDLYFSPINGDVAHFEVSQGAIEDLKSGKKRISIEDILTVGPDATIVRGYTELKLENQGGSQGLQGAVNTGAEKLAVAANQVKEVAQDTVAAAKDKAQDVANDPNVQSKAESLKQNVANALDTAKERSSQIGDVAAAKLNEAGNRLEDAANDPNTQANKEELKQKVSNAVDTAGQKIDEAKDRARLEATKASASADEVANEVRNDVNNAKDRAQDSMNNDDFDVDDNRNAGAGTVVIETK